MWEYKYKEVSENKFNNIGIAEHLSSSITSVCVSPFAISSSLSPSSNSSSSSYSSTNDSSECLVALGTHIGTLQVNYHSLIVIYKINR